MTEQNLKPLEIFERELGPKLVARIRKNFPKLLLVSYDDPESIYSTSDERMDTLKALYKIYEKIDPDITKKFMINLLDDVSDEKIREFTRPGIEDWRVDEIRGKLIAKFMGLRGGLSTENAAELAEKVGARKTDYLFNKVIRLRPFDVNCQYYSYTVDNLIERVNGVDTIAKSCDRVIGTYEYYANMGVHPAGEDFVEFMIDPEHKVL